MLNREDLEERELATLSRLACKARESRGRRIPEEEDPLRTCYQRDRDRILHSAAFRRLQQKTQVLPARTGDHFRTRLTHSLEVSQLARSACLSLGLNPDLAETVALAHDIGHPPFGHVGERVLQELMKDQGGFRHNAQGLRIVDLLEERMEGEVGLNLSYETRVCLLKSKIPEGFPIAEDLPREGPPFLEGMVVDLCDRVAYVSHDLEDALRSGLVDWEVFAELALPREAMEHAKARLHWDQGTSTPHLLRRRTVSSLVAILIRDLVVSSDRLLQEAHRLRSPEEARLESKQLIAHSSQRSKEILELLKTLNEHFYQHSQVLQAIHLWSNRIAEIYKAYIQGEKKLPPRFQSMAPRWGKARVVCDYIAGMTDRFLERHEPFSK
ncbi:MAG TPA: dNTP triphosphohydrolase [Planctomycetes bacterium]|nr:dNTP triphosphohydrolase [Planctomycetota bacterium]